jgi:hypothetical protein
VRASVTDADSANTQLLKRAKAWDPEVDEGCFIAMLRCDSGICGESVAVSGLSYQSGYVDDEAGINYETVYDLKYAYPPLHLFPIPKPTPPEVQAEIIAAFALVWSDPDAAATRVRLAVERLLDHFRIPRRKRTKIRMERLSLHRRIERFSEKRPEQGHQLFAIKWLGNAGAHESALTRDDIFDAFEILSHVLDELLDDQRTRIRKIAKEINRKKGPRSKTRRKQ